MSKRQQEEFLAAATELAQEFSSRDDTLSVSEVTALLSEAGSDPDTLLGRFHGAVSDLESRLWTDGKTPPVYLRRLVKQTAPQGALPQDPEAARGRVQDWLDRFQDNLSALLAPEQLQVLQAYRKRGDLSQRDIELLEQLEKKLKDRVSGDRRNE